MHTAPQSLLTCRNLSINVPRGELIHNLQLDIAAGQFVAVLGKNGTGKTLALHTLAGLRSEPGGEIELVGDSLQQLSRREIARRLALMPQDHDDAFPATVLETVLIGRHPYIGTWQWESSEDIALARDVLSTLGIADLEQRSVGTLSGGERRRLAAAQIMIQEPQVYLLDEPSNHLDPQHQLEVLLEFSKRTQTGAAVIASLHDVNLAERYADQCLLLYGDGRWLLETTEIALNERNLSELYGTPVKSIKWESQRFFITVGDRH